VESRILNPDATGRYDPHQLIEWWDQSAVSAGIVMIAGVGALGNEAAKNLSLAGTGNMVLVDFDHVERRNLSRSTLFSVKDVCRPKVFAARDAIHRLNPDVNVIPIEADVEKGLGAGVVARCDVVLGCLDSRAARMALNRLCFETGTPYIDGGLRVLDGAVKFFRPGGPCYECGLTETDYRHLAMRHPCPGSVVSTEDSRIAGDHEPTLITAAAITGGVMSQLALQLLCGRHLDGGWCITYRGFNVDMEKMDMHLRNDCTGHESTGKVDKTGLGASCSAHDLLCDGQILVLSRDVGFGRCPCGELVVVNEPSHGSGMFSKCGNCGANTRLSLTHRIGLNHPLAGVGLARLGVPPLAWLSIEGKNSIEYKELDADEIDVFNPDNRIVG